MIEIGVVDKIKKNYATVVFPRKQACENCKMCMKNRSEMSVFVIVDNELDAKIGDKVEVELGNRDILKSAFYVYLIPVILITLSFVILYAQAEWVQIIGVCVSALLSFGIIVLIDKYNKKNNRNRIKMIKIIDEGDLTND